MSEQEYIVSLNRGVDVVAFNAEMVNLTGAGFIPNRTVEVANARPGSQRNTHYYLTPQEVEILQQDKRVYGVELRPDLRDDITIGHVATQTGVFTKTALDEGAFVNWGLRRMISATDPYVNTIVAGGFDYTLSGAGVDIVIQDSGIQADHPEFEDSVQVNRVQQIDWYQAQSVVSGSMPAGHYTDYDGHGTHCAGIAAGKTYGWAKNSRIYAVKIAGLQGTSDPNTGIPISDCFDVIKEWHKAKPVDVQTGVKRPTIVNMSWGYGTSYFNIAGGNWRGTVWTGSSRRTDYGMTGSYNGLYYRHPVRIASVDTDIQELIDAGVHVCIAAGNGYHKIDISTGNDYNNYYTRNGSSAQVYYHRGGSPFDDEAIIVGNIDSTLAASGKEKIAASSERGPGITVFAPGTNIMSACSTTTAFTSGSYPGNSNFKICNISGTSMASPQVVGLLSTYLEINPAKTPAQALAWVTSNAATGILEDTTGAGIDYTVSTSLLEAENRFAFQPYNSNLVLGIAGQVTSEASGAVVTPTYALTSSASGVNEGDTFTITLVTTNLVNSSIVPYTITGVTSTDINGASLTGSFIVGTTNSVTFEASADSIFDDGTETFLLSLDNGLASQSVTIADTSAPSPTYFLSPSVATVNEGGSVTFTLTTGNVATGTSLPYTITGISTDDIGGASLTGAFVVGTTDTRTLNITADETSEGQETITLSLNNALATQDVIISDTSTVAASYSLNISDTTVNEGDSFTVNISATNGVAGVQVPYTITGVTSADIGGSSLTGFFTIGSAETVSFTVAEDITTEGTETLTFTLNNYPLINGTVTIVDTSLDIVSGTQTFTTSGGGSWTVPAGVTKISIMGIGGGAAGISGGTAGTISSGGGGGAIAFKNNITVTPGSVVNYTVGPGGSGATGNGGSTVISVGGISYTAGGGSAGTSTSINPTAINTLIVGGNGGTASGAWDFSKAGGIGGSSYRPNTSSAVVGGGGGAAGMGANGGAGSPQTALADATAQNAPSEIAVDGGIGSGSGGGHGYTADWASGTGSVVGGRGGGVTVTIGRSGLSGPKPTTTTTQTIIGAGTAFDGAVGNPGNVVGAAINAGAGGGGVLAHSLAGTVPGANSGIAGAVMISYPGDVLAYQFQSPSYSLASNKASVYEGSSFILSLTTNLTVTSTPVPYTITGVSSADIANEVLTGTLTPSSNTKTITVTEDLSEEGNETFVMTLDNGASNTSVSIIDSSTGTEQSYSGNVIASGSSAYTFSGATDRNGSYSGNNPYIVANIDDTLTFNVNAVGHPFYIKTQQGTGTGNQATGVINNGTMSGAVVYTPRTAGITYYQCSSHSAMNNKIYTTGEYWASSTDYTSASEEVIKVVGDTLGNTVAIAKSVSSSNVYSYFVYKLNPKGNLTWRKTVAVPSFLTSICLDSSNNIYVVGGDINNMVDPSYDATIYGQALAIKFNSDGVTQWSKKYRSWGVNDQAYFSDCCLGQDGVTLNCIGKLTKAGNSGDPTIEPNVGVGALWHRVTLASGAAATLTISGSSYVWPAVGGLYQHDHDFKHICYEEHLSIDGPGKYYYLAGTHIGRTPSTSYSDNTVSVQQKDKIIIRVYEEGATNIPTILREVTFEKKDATTDITLGGIDVSQHGVAVTINDTSTGKGEIYILHHQLSSVLQRIAMYDSTGTTQRNVLTDVKIDGTIVYVTGQQKEDSADNYTPYLGSLNGFFATIDTADLSTADSRLLLTTGNTKINSLWVDETASSVTKLYLAGQGNPGSKLSSGNSSQFVATVPVGTQDHYGNGIGNAVATISQTYEDWAIGKTGYVETRTAENSNFTFIAYTTWSASTSANALFNQLTGGQTTVPPYILQPDSTLRVMPESSGIVPSSPSVTSEYKMMLQPYATVAASDPTYTVAASSSSVNEGTSVTFTLTTTNVNNNTNVAYTITGVASSDIGGVGLTGNFVVTNNTAQLTLSISSDGITEGSETLLLSLDGKGQSSSVTINDTSTTASGEYVKYTSGTQTFTVPSGVTSIDIIAVGGGGGGEAGKASNGSGGGGGGGAVAYVNNVTVVPGDILTVNVGAAGSLGTCSVNNPFEIVNSPSSYYPDASTLTAPTNGGNTTIISGSDTILSAGGGSASTGTGGGAGGTFTTNSSYGTTRGGDDGGQGVSASGLLPGGGGGAAKGGSNYGAGGNGGAGRGEFYRSSGGYNYSKTAAAGRGGGIELYGSGSDGSVGSASPALVTSTSPLSFNYSTGGNGSVGSNDASATVSVGGGGGGGSGGRIRAQQVGSFYYYWFGTASGTGAQSGGVRIKWGSGSDFP
tara:strand:+ start:1541 stop:8431 length:6891 start_codon:yes stop_codon:yes gene_type:complete